MPHAVTVSEATAFFIISTIYHTSLLFYLFTFPRFPLNSYHGIEPATALAYLALLLVTFLPFVLLPVVSISLAIWATMSPALDAVRHPPARTHASRGNFNNPSFLAHNLLLFIVLIARRNEILCTVVPLVLSQRACRHRRKIWSAPVSAPSRLSSAACKSGCHVCLPF